MNIEQELREKGVEIICNSHRTLRIEARKNGKILAYAVIEFYTDEAYDEAYQNVTERALEIIDQQESP